MFKFTTERIRGPRDSESQKNVNAFKSVTSMDQEAEK